VSCRSGTSRSRAQGRRRDRGPPLLRAQRRRPQGHAARRAANAQANGVTQGGSTLTQQYVKNALLQAAAGDEEAQRAAREVSLERKLREARYALALERTVSKDEILERYMNIAYYGNGVYGIGTAASFYFGKPVQELSIGEGAMLAGIVSSPAGSTRSPTSRPWCSAATSCSPACRRSASSPRSSGSPTRRPSRRSPRRRSAAAATTWR
jgi:membrane peptidoglycan carboxypeptidase